VDASEERAGSVKTRKLYLYLVLRTGKILGVEVKLMCGKNTGVQEGVPPSLERGDLLGLLSLSMQKEGNLWFQREA